MTGHRRVRAAASLLAGAILLAVTASTAVAAAPTNDDIASATVVGALPYADGPYDTTEATTGATDPAFCYDPSAGADRATVWYSFTPAASGRFLADTFGSDYDTTLYVGTSNGSGGIAVIGCNDDAQGVQSAVAWDADAGTTYLIMVGTCCGGGTGGGGSLEFHVAEAPPAPTIDVTVNGVGRFSPYGSATISGTIACTNTAFAEIDVVLSQRVGRFSIHGFGAEIFDCSATPAPWSVVVGGDDGKFAGGQATADVSAFTCGIIECVDTFTHASIRLRR